MRFLILVFGIFLSAQTWASATSIGRLTEEIKQASPDSRSQLYQFRARAYSRKNMPEAALADLTASINLNPTIAAYRERAGILMSMGRFNEALADLNTIIRSVPGDLETHRLRSRIYYKTKQYDKALNDIDTILASDPGDHEMYRLRSKIYFETERYREAMEDARRVLAVVPEDKMSRLIVMESTTALQPNKNIVIGGEKRTSNRKRRVVRKLRLQPLSLPPFDDTWTREKPRKKPRKAKKSTSRPVRKKT